MKITFTKLVCLTAGYESEFNIFLHVQWREGSEGSEGIRGCGIGRKIQTHDSFVAGVNQNANRS